MNFRSFIVRWLAGLATSIASLASAAEKETPSAPRYKQVSAILRKYCLACHNAADAEGKLVMDRYASLMRGGEHGPAIVPGKSGASRMILLLTAKAKPVMPPEDNERPKPQEIALLRAWIDAEAKGPDGAEPDPTILVPRIDPTAPVRRAIAAVAYSPDGKLAAVARYGVVEIYAAEAIAGLSDGKDKQGVKPPRLLKGHAGNVNDVAFSADGKMLVAAAGQPGRFGELKIWNPADGRLLRTIRGHRDSIYAVALSPDARLVASGGYDQAIHLWQADSGRRLRSLAGHNGAVFDLAYHPGGKMLASASADRTVKLWDVASGRRLETFGQPLKELYALAFHPDGRRLAAAGVDNRIRVWRISPPDERDISPILHSRFAHDAAILRLAWSADGRTLASSAEDRTVKVWNAATMTERQLWMRQPDWAAALAISPDGKTLLAGRLDGSWQTYPLGDQAAIVAETAPVDPAQLVGRPGEHPPGKLTEAAESEPNDTPGHATPLAAPAVATGRIMPAEQEAPADVDLYRFRARAGEAWIVETDAARSKSPLDSKIEVLDAAGRPVPRVLLRAVRDSYVTFRSIDSSTRDVRVANWEEMYLNQYLLLGGEVCKIYRMPQGPDSGINFYPRGGSRHGYFDTSATTHALDEPVYVVEPYRPGTPLADSGLPVFTLYYENDDDARRKLGRDSRLTFTAPADGEYLVRVGDVRGFGGEKFQYRLTVRRAWPDFSVSLSGGATVAAGSGQRISLKAQRKDEFDGPIQVEIDGLPTGYSVTTPIVIEAGHLEALGVITADVNARQQTKETWDRVKVTATATVAGRPVVKTVANLGHVKLAPRPKLIVRLLPDEGETPAGEKATKVAVAKDENVPAELTIAPGRTITAMIEIERNGFDGEVKFDVDNLPHGVIVDNIGLSGVLIRVGETRRQIFFTAEHWVPGSTRLIHAVGNAEGNQASRPLLIHVRRAKKEKVTATKFGETGGSG